MQTDKETDTSLFSILEKLRIERVILSLLMALGLSIILVLIFPRAFLHEEAVWTHQSDVGRVDISLEGDIRNGRIEAEGEHLSVTRPEWFAKKNYQGTEIQFPVSYRWKHYQITLTPHADSPDGWYDLVMNFRGQDFRINNKRVPAYVRFKNIKVNGETIADIRMVCHDQPFRYSLKKVKSGQPIKLDFKIRKPLTARDIRWGRIVPGMVCLFAIILLILPKKFLLSWRGSVSLIGSRDDILQICARSYRNIDPIYRKSFWLLFGALCLVFGFHTIQFLWGNHDWFLLNRAVTWRHSVWCGRPALHLFKVYLLNGVYLPIVYDVITFMALALNAVLLCTYWKLEKRVAYFVLCGLVLTAQPFTLSMVYYVNMLPEVFIGVTYVLIALLLLEKVAFGKASRMKKGLLSVLATILLSLSLATYPVLINTIAVVFVGRLLVQSFDWDGTWKQFKGRFIPFTLSVACIALGVGIYKVIVTFVFPLTEFYNTQTLPLEAMPERWLDLLKQCIYQLYDYPYPFISQIVLWVFLGFTILLSLSICLTGNVKQKCMRLLLLFGALFATQTAMVIANTHLVDGRVELFGFVFFEALVMVLAFTRLGNFKNISIVAACYVVFVSAINDLDCLRVWKLGFDAEKMLWNRVLTRLEMQPGFDANKKYKIIEIGQPISLRPKFYAQARRKFLDSGNNLLAFSYDAPWNLFRAHEFYYPTSFLDREIFSTDISQANYKTRLKRLYDAGILDKAKAWPHENGLIVWDDIILYVTDQKVLDDYRKQLAREFPKTNRSAPTGVTENEKR